MGGKLRAAVAMAGRSTRMNAAAGARKIRRLGRMSQVLSKKCSDAASRAAAIGCDTAPVKDETSAGRRERSCSDRRSRAGKRPARAKDAGGRDTDWRAPGGYRPAAE